MNGSNHDNKNNLIIMGPLRDPVRQNLELNRDPVRMDEGEDDVLSRQGLEWVRTLAAEYQSLANYLYRSTYMVVFVYHLITRYEVAQCLLRF